MGMLELILGKQESRSDDTGRMVNTDTVSADLLKLLSNPDQMTKEKALQIPTVRACIDLIAGTIARLPIRLYKKDSVGDPEEVLGDPRVQYLNADTGDIMTARMMWRAIFEDYFLGKGAFIYIDKDLGQYKGLYYVKEEDISLQYTTIDPIFKDCIYQVQGHQYRPFEFIRLLRDTHDGFKSRSLVEENPLLFATAYGYLVFENSNIARGGLKRGFLKSARRLASEAMDTLKEGFSKIYRDPDSAVIVLNDSMDFKEASASSQELQLNENKESCAAYIASLFGVPYAMLSGAKNNLTNATEDKKRFISTCLAIMLDIECSLNKDLLKEDEKDSLYFAFDTSELTRESIQERYEAYRIGLEANFLQIDEVRRAENLEPLGIDFIQLKLGSVFYDPKTGIVYTPNTNAAMDLSEGATMNLGDVLAGGGTGQNRSGRINLPDGTTKNIGEGGDSDGDDK